MKKCGVNLSGLRRCLLFVGIAMPTYELIGQNVHCHSEFISESLIEHTGHCHSELDSESFPY